MIRWITSSVKREWDGRIWNEEEGYATGRKLKGSQPS
jgi:hypothetical protein